jgi:hypothetical protein
MGTRARNEIRFARIMLGSWRDILEPSREAGPVLLTPYPIFIADLHESQDPIFCFKSRKSAY